MFTAQYAMGPYIKQENFVFKWLIFITFIHFAVVHYMGLITLILIHAIVLCRLSG